jgi:endonuclease YncB( thermonuclease family)
MRIAQIQSMRERPHVSTTLGLVALALASSVVFPASSDTSARQRQQSAEAVTGLAWVVDGDTIDVDDVRVRLEGIDAPETGQTCARRWFGRWSCGAAASAALAKLIEGRTVTCVSRGTDKYGRMLGVCFAAGHDVNAWMVRHGHAWAFVKYSTSYVAEEAQAKREGLGIWQGPATPPWEHRAKRWDAVAMQAPAGCAIKGNVTRNGKIYHMPWSPWYDQIRLEPDKGERWFCTEAEAVAAGWRPVRAH